MYIDNDRVIVKKIDNNIPDGGVASHLLCGE